MTKELSYVMLKLHNVRIEPSNMIKKRKGTIEYDKRTITYDVGTVQYEDGTIKCKKKVREPPNVTKKLSLVMLELHNVRIEPSNVRKR